MPPPSVSVLSAPSSRALRRHTWFIDLLRPLLFFSVCFLAVFSGVDLATAETSSLSSTKTLTVPTTATIAAGTDGYNYVGCYNETTALSGTGSGTRALYGGTNEVLPGVMTVERCLGFCKGGMGKKGYRFAGLEYSRECWCASQLFSLSSKVADAECNLPCDGDKSQVCGGDLRISVYDLEGDVDSGAAGGKSTEFILGLALVVGGGVFAQLLW